MNDIIFVGEHVLTYNVKWHYHDYWELIFCTGGTGCFHFIDKNMEYEENEMVAIPPGIRHSNTGTEGFTNIHIVMRDPGFLNKEPFKVVDNKEGRLRKAFDDARYFYLMEDKKKRAVMLPAIGLMITSLITAMQDEEPLSEKVQYIQDEIMEHFSEPKFDLEKMIKEKNFNYDYLRKQYKKETGYSPLEYLTRLRMKKAEGMLASMSNKEYQIAEVAENCGYDNALYFSRVFKKYYGCAPSEFAVKSGQNAVYISEETKKY